MNKLASLQMLAKYYFNIMPFWLIRSQKDIPLLPSRSLINVRSQKTGDRTVSYVNLTFSTKKISELYYLHGPFILQSSYPKIYNKTTNTIRIVDGEISHLEVVVPSELTPVVETRDIADGRACHMITLPRWRAFRCNHLLPYLKELRDLEILLPKGTHVIEFNTTNKSVGTLNQRIVFWEIIQEST